jgi:tRNA A37 threonylcarbamoyladenosine synthetase subunit TsaC/SUA5/YrdC
MSISSTTVYYYRLHLVIMMLSMLFLLLVWLVVTSHAFSVGPASSSLPPPQQRQRALPRSASSFFDAKTVSISSISTSTSSTATALFGKKGWKSPLNSLAKVCTPTLHVELEYGVDDVWKLKSADLVDILHRGGVGVLPTETGYGLVTSLAVATGGVERLLRIKKMHACKKPFSILCSDLATIDDYCALYTLPKQVFKILKKNLPGPYTFLLQAKTNTASRLSLLNDDATCQANPGWKRDTVGIRMPSDAILRYFQDELYAGGPLLVSTLTFNDDDDDDDETNDDDDDDDTVNEMYQLVRPQPDDFYWNEVDFVVDAGTRPMDGSTVIDLTSRTGDPQLVRQGLGALELTV